MIAKLEQALLDLILYEIERTQDLKSDHESFEQLFRAIGD